MLGAGMSAAHEVRLNVSLEMGWRYMYLGALAAFAADNAECPLDDMDMRGIEALAVGESWRIYLGAGGITDVQRVS